MKEVRIIELIAYVVFPINIEGSGLERTDREHRKSRVEPEGYHVESLGCEARERKQYGEGGFETPAKLLSVDDGRPYIVS